MDFFKNGVRRCEVKGAEIFEGSVEQLKEQGLMGEALRATFAVVTMEYDPYTKKHIDFFNDEEEAIEKICEIGRRSPKLEKMCRDCDNFGAVCHGMESHKFSGCLMKHMDRQEFVDYNRHIMEYAKKGDGTQCKKDLRRPQ